MPDARKTCLYCGTVAPPAGDTVLAPTPPPGPLDSIQAVLRLFSSAHEAMARGDGPAVARSVARIFLEVHPDDLQRVLATMTEGWLKGMLQLAGAARLARATLCCQQALASAGQKQWNEAGLHFTEARAVYADLPRVNATMEMLALGARHAGEQAGRTQEREERLTVLIHQASRLLTTPGRKAESMPLFEQALAVLQEDPERPQNRERAEKIRSLMADFERSGEVDAVGPAGQLPPAGSLSPEGWDDLGLQFLAQHPQHAKICFERAALGQPDNGQFWLHLATCLIAVEAPDQEIISVFGLAVQRSPGELKAWVGLGAALQEAGRFGEAVAAWDQAIALEPSAGALQHQRAFCQGAESLLSQGATWDAKAWNQEGSRRLDTREWNLSDFAFSRALTLAPNYPGALMGKGLANLRWAHALKEEGNSAAALRFRMADQALSQALVLRPESEFLKPILEECRLELGGAS